MMDAEEIDFLIPIGNPRKEKATQFPNSNIFLEVPQASGVTLGT